MKSALPVAPALLLGIGLAIISCAPSTDGHNYCTGDDCPATATISPGGGGGGSTGDDDDDDDATSEGTPPEGNAIQTVAGTGKSGSTGDGAAATEAELDAPRGVIAGAGGTFYIADTGNDSIRKVDANGVITTVAGNGTGGFKGDGGPATKASLNRPGSIALDGLGNLYIADTGNHRVRVVDLVGNISTVAGTGSQGLNGDGYYATYALLNEPQGVGIGLNGSLYIADTGNSRIREVNAQSYIVTVAGTSAGFSGDQFAATLAQLRQPTGVGFDSTGALLIVDTGNSRIRRVATTAGSGDINIINTVVGGGTSTPKDGAKAISVSLDNPLGVATDSKGMLFVADGGANQIYRVDLTGILTIFAGEGGAGDSGDGGSALKAELDTPWGLDVSNFDDLYIADSGNDRIRLVVY